MPLEDSFKRNCYILSKLELIKLSATPTIHKEDIFFLGEQYPSFVSVCAEKLERSPEDFVKDVKAGQISKTEFFGLV
jgi:hypothetical protein